MVSATSLGRPLHRYVLFHSAFKWLTLFFPISLHIFILCFSFLKHKRFLFMFFSLLYLHSYSHTAITAACSETEHHIWLAKNINNVSQEINQICFKQVCKRAPQSHKTFRTFQYETAISMVWMLRCVPVWWKSSWFSSFHLAYEYIS